MSALTIGMNSDRDLYLDRFGNLAMKTDEDAMADLLTQRLSTLINELIFNKSDGIPYMGTVFDKGTAGVPALQAAMQARLLTTEHVVGVAYLDVAFQGTQLFFEAGVATEYGNIVLRSQE